MVCSGRKLWGLEPLATVSGGMVAGGKGRLWFWGFDDPDTKKLDKGGAELFKALVAKALHP